MKNYWELLRIITPVMLAMGLYILNDLSNNVKTASNGIINLRERVVVIETHLGIDHTAVLRRTEGVQ